MNRKEVTDVVPEGRIDLRGDGLKEYKIFEQRKTFEFSREWKASWNKNKWKVIVHRKRLCPMNNQSL